MNCEYYETTNRPNQQVLPAGAATDIIGGSSKPGALQLEDDLNGCPVWNIHSTAPTGTHQFCETCEKVLGRALKAQGLDEHLYETSLRGFVNGNEKLFHFLVKFIIQLETPHERFDSLFNFFLEI
jgi:hypothetical protein